MHTIRFSASVLLAWVRVALTTWGLGLCVCALAQADGVLVVRPDRTTVLLSAEQLTGLPRVTFSASAHDKTRRFEGSDLRDVLRAAGAELPDSPRGTQLCRVVSVHAGDGYVVVFALAELVADDPCRGEPGGANARFAAARSLPRSMAVAPATSNHGTLVQFNAVERRVTIRLPPRARVVIEAAFSPRPRPSQ